MPSACAGARGAATLAPVTLMQPGSVIDLTGAANCRDLGGWAVGSEGVVSSGRIYRSTALNGLTDAGIDQLAALGLETVYDLRTTLERDLKPDRLPTGLEEVHLDVLADDPSNAAAGAADLESVLSDPKALEVGLAGAPLSSFLSEAYRGVVNLPSAVASYRRLFTELARVADGEAGPTLFHCTTGKDRTGWASAALLTFLGVAHDDVVAEYLLTNTQILPFTQRYYDTFAAAGGDPEVLRPVLGVERSYLDTAFEEMADRFGSIEDYFGAGLGLDDATLEALRSGLIEPRS